MAVRPRAPLGIRRPLGCVLRAVFGAAYVALLSVGLTGCTDDGVANEGFVTPTTISVDPIFFLGDVPCSKDAGAMRSYVATITDRTTGFTLASSPPTPCTAAVGFRFVVTGHMYSAQVDGYEEPADELLPVGGENSGARQIELRSGGPALPRWHSSCGEQSQDAAAVAEFLTNVPVESCTPMQDISTEPSPTGIAIDTTAAVSSLGCAADGGLVQDVLITPQTPALATAITACGGAPLVYQSDALEDGTLYTFRLSSTVATESDDTLTFASTCVARVETGLIRTAQCDPLIDSGAITLSVDALLADEGLECGVDVSHYSVTFERQEGETLFVESGKTPCGVSALLSPVPAGAYGGTLVAVAPDGTPVLEAACGASVSAAETVTALCSLIP